jgi:hypothetical protein
MRKSVKTITDAPGRRSGDCLALHNVESPKTFL